MSAGFWPGLVRQLSCPIHCIARPKGTLDREPEGLLVYPLGLH